MHQLSQLSCHSLYLPDSLLFMFNICHLYKMLIPHDSGHFCPEMDGNETAVNLLTSCILFNIKRPAS